MIRTSRVRSIAKGTKTTTLSLREKLALQVRAEAIATLQDEIDCKAAEAALLRDALRKDMEKHGLATVERGNVVAEIVTPQGRSSTYIAPLLLRKSLNTEKDWLDCLTVSVTKAKQYLGEKELNAISVVTPAVSGSPTLKVVRKKVKGLA